MAELKCQSCPLASYCSTSAVSAKEVTEKDCPLWTLALDGRNPITSQPLTQDIPKIARWGKYKRNIGVR